VAGEKVLLVDDTRLNRELAKDILELQGYAIVEATNGQEAIDHARQENPDVVLLDIELPDMSGLEVVRVLKDDPRTKGIPVVAFTAHVEGGKQEDIVASGCAGCITKPIDAATFPQRVAAFLK
jgi:two-component system cell cycle response regulator DivK